MNEMKKEMTYKNFKIDYKQSGAVIYKDNKFVKAFASDDPNTSEVTGLQKAKKYIDTLLNETEK